MYFWFCVKRIANPGMHLQLKRTRKIPIKFVIPSMKASFTASHAGIRAMDLLNFFRYLYSMAA